VPIALFEALCVLVVVATLLTMARSRPLPALAAEYAVLAAAAWLGEETSILAYRFYAYATHWHLRLVDVPVLVPLIWPLVILSARDVARALAPDLGRLGHALLVGAVVTFDASLVEVVAVRAGLWGWAEPGHLGVPLAGIFGWGWFAVGAALAPRPGWGLLTGPAAAHLGVLASWWVFFRWVLRGELGAAGYAVIALASVAALGGVLAARRAGRALAPSVWLPRVAAALLFAALLLLTAPTSAALWAHTALVAVPYLAATRLRADLSASTSPG
jgi:hypothetical protein